MPPDVKDIITIKNKAEDYFTKGKLKDALDAYESIKSHAGKDPKIPLRIGDICRKMGRDNDAVKAYELSANVFISQGFITKAIGVCKMIMDIDPSLEAVQKKIADLYAERGFATGGEKKSEEAMPQKVHSTEMLGAGEQAAHFPRTPLFSDLTKDELLALISKVKHHIISQGVFIFKEGDRGDSIYIINSGTVDIIGKDKKGNDVILSSLKEVDFFGEFGFFANARREASVRTSSPVNILEIVKSDMDAIIAKHRRVAQALFDFYKERVVDRLMALSLVFEPMAPADRKIILSRLFSQKFERGVNIVKKGEIGDTMYLIKEGKVEVWVQDPAKGRIVLATLSEGDFFGEIAMATARPRVASVTAIGDTELVLFSRPMIKDILSKYPVIKKILEDVIKARVADVVKARGLQSAALV